MYDVLGTSYEDRKKITFSGFDVDKDSLKLAQEKANTLGYTSEQVKIAQCDIVSAPLPENQYDAIVCNGFSFYINDESLEKVIKNVKKALKPNGVFLMSFIQPSTMWQMDEDELRVSKIVKEILDAVPMNWSANLRTDNQVRSLVEKGGLINVSILEERHQIHPLIEAFKA